MTKSRARWRTFYLVAILGVTILGAFLRFYRLSEKALWLDELAAIELATAPGGIPSILQSTTRWRYPHPPLFMLVLYALFQGFQVSEFTARLLPALSGVVSIPLIYRYVGGIVNRRAGLMAASFLALSPYHLFYSQEARPYALSLALIIVTWLILRRALRTGSFVAWVGHTVCLVALFYLHYFNAVVIVGESLYVLARAYLRREPRSLWIYAFSGGVAALLFAPALLQAQSGTVVLNRTYTHISLPPTLMTIFVGETRYATDLVRGVTLGLFSLLLLLGILRLRRRVDPLLMNLMPIAAAFGFVFAFLRIIGSVVPPYEERQFMPVLPFLLALAASGGEFLLTATHFPEQEGSLNVSAAWRFGGRLLGGLLALVVVVTAGVTLESYYFDFVKNVDVKVAEYLNPRVSPGDIVICDHYSVATTLHYYGSDVPDYATRGHSTGEGWEFSEQLALFPDEGIRWTIDLEDVLVHDRIWLVELSWETTGELREVILAETNPVSQTEVGPYVVWLLEPGG